MSDLPFVKPRVRFRGDRAAAANYVGAGMRLLYHCTLVTQTSQTPVHSLTQTLPDGAVITAAIREDMRIIEITPPGVPEHEPLVSEESYIEPQVALLNFEDTQERWGCPTGLYLQRSFKGLYVDPEDPDEKEVVGTTVYMYKPLQGVHVHEGMRDSVPFRDMTQLRKGKRVEFEPGSWLWNLNGYAPIATADLDEPGYWYAYDGLNVDVALGRLWQYIEGIRKLANFCAKFQQTETKLYLNNPGVNVCGKHGKDNKFWYARLPNETVPIIHNLPFALQFSINGVHITVNGVTELPGQVYELLDISADGTKILVMSVIGSATIDDIPNESKLAGSNISSKATWYQSAHGLVGRPTKLLGGIAEIEFTEEDATLTVLRRGMLYNTEDVTPEKTGGVTEPPMLFYENSELPDYENYVSYSDQLPPQLRHYVPRLVYKRIADTSDPESGSITLTEFFEIDYGIDIAHPDYEAFDLTSIPDDPNPALESRYVKGVREATVATIGRLLTHGYVLPEFSLLSELPGAPPESVAESEPTEPLAFGEGLRFWTVPYDVSLINTAAQTLGAYYGANGEVQYVTYNATYNGDITTACLVQHGGKLRIEREVTLHSDSTPNEYAVRLSDTSCYLKYEYLSSFSQESTHEHEHPQKTTSWQCASVEPLIAHYDVNGWYGVLTDEQGRSVPGGPPVTPTPDVNEETLDVYYDADVEIYTDNNELVRITGDFLDGLEVPVNRMLDHTHHRLPFPSLPAEEPDFGGVWVPPFVGYSGFFFTWNKPVNMLGRMSTDATRNENSQAPANYARRFMYHLPPAAALYCRVGIADINGSDSLMTLRSQNAYIPQEYRLVLQSTGGPGVVYIPTALNFAHQIVEVFDGSYCSHRSNYVEAVFSDNYWPWTTTVAYPASQTAIYRTATATPVGVTGTPVTWPPAPDIIAGAGIASWAGGWPAGIRRVYETKANGSWNPNTEQLVHRCDRPVTWVGAYQTYAKMQEKYPNHPLNELVYEGEESIPTYEELVEE